MKELEAARDALRAMGHPARLERVRAWTWWLRAVDAVVTDAPPEVVAQLLPGTRWEPMAGSCRAFF
ncbi:MAG: hypothetical protein KFF45_04515 [Thioalkalivibrio sp.]|nr:hypothetical protein [Thioalkalivibrio sp.]